MSLNFPADPIANPIYEAPNGVTYIWNDSIQSWVVQSVTYDDDYVNRTGDTMTGHLNFSANQLGIKWGGNPRILFMTSGVAELRGKFSATGPFECREGLNLTNNNSLIQYKGVTRLKFSSTESILAFDNQDLLKVNASGVEYHGNFTQDKNVTTVEYVTNEIQNVQDQIDNITNDLDTIIEDIIDQKAVLLEGNQTVNGNKTFTGDTKITGVTGISTGNPLLSNFLIKTNSNSEVFGVRDDGVVFAKTRDSNSGLSDLPYMGAGGGEQVINLSFANYQYLHQVEGDAEDNTTSTGIQVTNANRSTGPGHKTTQKITCRKATINRYGVNKRGLLPQGSNNPSNSDLQVGQMYFNTSTKRVFIRVN